MSSVRWIWRRYIKTKDGAIDWLINIYEKFRKNEESREADKLFGGWYISLEDEEYKS